jgi:hypothetical protein
MSAYFISDSETGHTDTADVEQDSENQVTLVFSHTDSDSDSVELYRVVWPDGTVTHTVDTTASAGLVQLDTTAAIALAAALIEALRQ